MSINVPSVIQAKINEIKNIHEKDIAQLLFNLGFEFIDCNKKIKNEKGEIIGEIDLIFSFENHLFLIEVTSKTGRVHADTDHWFSRWSDKKNLDILFSDLNITRCKVIRIYIDLFHDSKSSKLTSLQHHLKEDFNHYLFGDDISYFKDIYNKIGKIAKNDFLNFIKFPRRRISRPIKAIKFYINNIPAYSFVGRVDELLETCYIQRRLDKKEGYQRALKYSRIREIANNIKENKIVAFPNSILVNSKMIISHNNCKEEDCPKIVEIFLPLSYCELVVVDGQHRLLGFANVDKSIQESSYLPVIAFQEMDQKDEIKMFIDINSKQKRVDKNLVLLLKHGFDWTIDDLEYYEKIAVSISLELDEKGPLKNKIYFGIAREKPKGKVTLTTIVSLLKGNGFVRRRGAIWQTDPEDIDTPLNKTKKIISLINKYLSEYKIDNEKFFFQNIGLRMIFRLLRTIEKNRQAGNLKLNYEQLFIDLNEILSQEPIDDLRTSYGEGGASNSALLLCDLLKKNVPERYQYLETDLRRLKGVQK